MKKIFTLVIVLIVFMMQSCVMRSYVNVGMDDETPSTCVHEIHHHHLFFGIFNIGSDEDMSRYIGGKESFRIRTCITFMDAVLTVITSGIYTPSTTQIYLPNY